MQQKSRHLSWQFVHWKRCFVKSRFTALAVSSAEYHEHVVGSIASNSAHNGDTDRNKRLVYFVAVASQQMKPTSSPTPISLIVPNQTVPNN